MARIVRVLFALLLLTIAFPAYAAPPARPEAAPCASPALGASLDLSLSLDYAAVHGTSALVRLRLETDSALQAVEVRWKRPQGVRPAVGRSLARVSLGVGEVLERVYVVPCLGDETVALRVCASGVDESGALAEVCAGARLVRDVAGVVSLEACDAEEIVPIPNEAPLPPGADSFEADDSHDAASLLTPGTAQKHNTHVPGDQDWAHFTAIEGTVYAVEVLNRGCAFQTDLSLFGPDGAPELLHTSGNLLTWKATATGPCFVRVRHQDPGAFGKGNTYSLVVRRLTVTRDSYEVDGTLLAARRVLLGRSYRHNFSQAGDQDWCKFTATTGRSYIVETISRRANARPLLTLCDEGGAPLARGFLDLTWTASEGGVYYVRVANRDANLFGPTTQYDLRVRAITPQSVEMEPNDSSSTAGWAGLGGWRRLNFSSARDQDWAVTALTAGAPFAVETARWGANAWPIVELYGPDHVTLLDTDRGGSGLCRTSVLSSTYYLKVVNANPDRFDALAGHDATDTGYDLRVAFQDPYDALGDDTCAEAPWILIASSLFPAPQQHNLLEEGDEDWVKFLAVSGQSYLAEIVGPDRRANPQMEVYTDCLAAPLASAYGRLTWTATASGIAYLRVRNDDPAVYGAYTSYGLRVHTFTPAPDGKEEDDSPDDAKLLALGTSYRHAFHDRGDEDWARFTATGGKSYIVEVPFAGPYCHPLIQLYDSGEQALWPVESQGQPVAWTAPATAVYYVRVKSEDPATFGPGTQYDLRVRSFTPAPDAYEADNSFTEAKAHDVALSALYHRKFHVSFDEDWAAFSATGGTTYAIEALNLDCGNDTVLTLYGRDGRAEIDTSDDVACGRSDSRLVWTCPLLEDGTYFLRVTRKGGFAYGAGTGYDLRIRVLPD